MIVKLRDVVTRVNNNIDRFNTDIEYYLGKGHGECDEIAITERGNLKNDVGMLGFKFHFAFEPGDSLFFSRSFALRKAGMAMYKGVCSDSTYILRTKDDKVLLPDYLPAIIQSDVFWEYCDTHHTGGVNFLINWSTLADYEFELPSLAEQRALAKKLWAAYRLKESYKKLLAATQEMVKSQFIEMIGSKDWPQVKLKDIVHEDCPISYGIVQPGDDLEDGVPIVRPIDMNDTHLIDIKTLKHTSKQISDSYSRTILRGDEILVCVRGTTGLIALANGLKDCNVTRGITPLYFKPQYNREYLFRAFLGEQVQEYIKANTIGSTLKGINMSKLRELPICMPPKDIQKQFVTIAEQADKSVFELRKSIEAIDAVIKSLINNPE